MYKVLEILSHFDSLLSNQDLSFHAKQDLRVLISKDLVCLYSDYVEIKFNPNLLDPDWDKFFTTFNTFNGNPLLNNIRFTPNGIVGRRLRHSYTKGVDNEIPPLFLPLAIANEKTKLFQVIRSVEISLLADSFLFASRATDKEIFLSGNFCTGVARDRFNSVSNLPLPNNPPLKISRQLVQILYVMAKSFAPKEWTMEVMTFRDVDLLRFQFIFNGIQVDIYDNNPIIESFNLPSIGSINDRSAGVIFNRESLVPLKVAFDKYHAIESAPFFMVLESRNSMCGIELISESGKVVSRLQFPITRSLGNRELKVCLDASHFLDALEILGDKIQLLVISDSSPIMINSEDPNKVAVMFPKEKEWQQK